MKSRFCITEVGLPIVARETELGASTDVLQEYLETLLNLIRSCKNDKQTVCRWSQLESVEILPGVPLYDLMYQVGQLDRVLQQALQTTLRTCVNWDVNDQDEALAGDSKIRLDGVEIDSPSVAWVHAKHFLGEALACLCVQNAVIHGVHNIEKDAQACEIYCFTSVDDKLCRDFYRSIPRIEGLDGEAYLRLAPWMFPNLYFKHGIESEFRRFAGGYISVREDLTKHLSVLNDDFRSVLDANGGDGDQTAKRLGASRGIDMSPESSNTKRDSAAWRHRKISIEGKDIYCDWHTKLSPTKNRIHFYPGRADIAGGRIIIGIFHEHLPT